MIEFIKESFCIVASNGYEIACHHWRPDPLVKNTTGRVLLLHGIQSHAGWYEHLGETLAKQGVEVLMPDRRGSGANQLDRGHASSSGRLICDLDETLSACGWDNGLLAPVLAGISWGGKLAVIAAAKRPSAYSGLALVAPGLFAKVRPPLLTQIAIALSALIMPRKQFDIPLSDPALFTSNQVRQNFIASDAKTLHQATARFFIVSRSMDLQLRRAGKRLKRPVLLQLAEHDRIVNNNKIRAYVDRSQAPTKKIITYPDSHHTLEFENGPVADQYAMDLALWVIHTCHFPADWQSESLIDESGQSGQSGLPLVKRPIIAAKS